MSVVTIRPGQLVLKDPSEKRVYQFDWDTSNIAIGAAIASSTFEITAIHAAAGDTPLTKDNESLLTGNRKTQLRLLGGTLGRQYEITNHIITNEVPAQEKERSFKILIEHK